MASSVCRECEREDKRKWEKGKVLVLLSLRVNSYDPCAIFSNCKQESEKNVISTRISAFACE